MDENWANFARIAAATGALIVAIEMVWRLVGERRGWPHEAGRKAHHIGIGLIAAFLNQWLVYRWSGFFLGLGFGLLLLIGYRLGAIRSLFDTRPGEAVIRKSRESWIGPACFSLAVALLSYFFWEDVPIYRASVLILALGDSAAAIFGLLFGRHGYQLFGSRRSLEGNVALVVLASAVCLASLPERGATAMGFAWLVGIFLCLAETIAPLGFDNIALPMAAAALLGLARTEAPPAALAVTLPGLEALALLTAAAATFTVAHLRPGFRHPAVLALGAAVVLLAEMGNIRALALLAAFMGVALAADRLRGERNGGAAPAGRDIVKQLLPTAGFVAISAATGNPNYLMGSLATLTVVGGRCWSVFAPVAAPGAANRMTPMALESLSGLGGAWAALLLAGLATVLFDLGRTEASALAIVLASAAGGLVGSVLQRSAGGLEPSGEPLIRQFLPAVLALAAVPIVSLLLVGLSG